MATVNDQLETAIYNAEVDLVKELVERRGADVNHTTQGRGYSMLYYALYCACAARLGIEDDMLPARKIYKQIVDILVENGADVNFSVKNLIVDRTFIHSILQAATNLGYGPIVETLVDYGMNVCDYLSTCTT